MQVKKFGMNNVIASIAKQSLPAIFLSMALVACGDDKGSSPNELPDEVADMDELEEYKCNMSLIGEIVYVKDKQKNYECDGDHWFESYNQPKSSSSKKQGDGGSEAAKSSSSSAKSSSSSVTLATLCKTETEDNCEYGELVDDRDGKKYKTVKIGDQWWMAQNLDYTDGSEPDSYSGPIWTSINKAVDSVRIGRLYVWKTAIKVCPDGWHLPNNDEWSVLLNLVGGEDVAGKILKSQTGWTPETGANGIDAVGFSALPAGYKQPNIVTFATTMSGFWSATEDEQDKAYSVGLFAVGDAMHISNSGSHKTSGYSVRCLKN